ncbi:cytochrome P450 [Pelagibius sp. Alg239-R121]|uniref:cytochrome P450 n=1 Tax=Pelagibius sp. Alg239-R121 TaxID=2993448 RepID=UPI0024A616CE|nr:cytochrome P450 [Pelagibius sp. Alg239-R121]
MANPVPVIDDISLESLYADPYPSFQRLQRDAPVAFVRAAGINLVTRFDDIVQIERDFETFASSNPVSLMNRVMGHSLMRKDGEDHRLERKAIEPSFRPGVVRNHWAPRFRVIADDLIDQFDDHGATDLFGSFAAPMASLSLMEMLGLRDVSWQELAIWSQSLMDAVGNYGQDPEVIRRGQVASDGIDAAIEVVLPKLEASPDPSIISSMLQAEDKHSIAQIRANVKVIIGGGLNEPRDTILTTAYGLLSNPDQRACVMEDANLWSAAFEEAVRWISPIGMYPRRVTRDVVLGGMQLREGDQLGICVGAANRDESHFDRPDLFDILRPKQSHLGFGAGPHYCAGTWVARQMVGAIALPALFGRLKDLRLDEAAEVKLGGWVFRGPLSLPVRWSI